MELIAVALIVSFAYVYAPVLRVHASRRFGVSLPAGAVAPDAAPIVVPPKPVELPPDVEQWCAGWYDPWAQQESRDRARKLFAESGDWTVVLQTLESNADQSPAV